jgi:UrcA family protein
LESYRLRAAPVRGLTAKESSMITSSMSRRLRGSTSALAACLLGAVAGTAGAAGVASDADVRTMRVTYSDLDLATAQGSRALYARIESAAREVCAADDQRNLAAVAAARACTAQAVAQAVSTVHSPMLAAAYAAHRLRG